MPPAEGQDYTDDLQETQGKTGNLTVYLQDKKDVKEQDPKGYEEIKKKD